MVLQQTENTQSGYGFVHFAPNPAGIASALQALSAVNNTTLEEVTYSVEASKNLLKQFKEDSQVQPAAPPAPPAQLQAQTHQPGKGATGHVRQKSGEINANSTSGKGANPSQGRSRSRSDLAASLKLNLNITHGAGSPAHGGSGGVTAPAPFPKPAGGPPARYPAGAGLGIGHGVGHGHGQSPRIATTGGGIGIGGAVSGSGGHHSPRYSGASKPGMYASHLGPGALMEASSSGHHLYVLTQAQGQGQGHGQGQMQGRQFPKHHAPAQASHGATGAYGQYAAPSTGHGRLAHDPYAVQQALKGSLYPVGTGTGYGAHTGQYAAAMTSQGPPGKQPLVPSRPVHQLTGHALNVPGVMPRGSMPSQVDPQSKSSAGGRPGPEAVSMHAHHGLPPSMATPAQMSFQQPLSIGSTAASGSVLHYDAAHAQPPSPSRLNLPAHSIPAPIQTTGFGTYLGPGYGELQTRRSTPGSGRSAHSQSLPQSQSSHAASPYSTASSPSLATHTTHGSSASSVTSSRHGSLSLSARYSPRADSQPYVPRDPVLPEHGRLAPIEDPHVALRSGLSRAREEEFGGVTNRPPQMVPTLAESLGVLGEAQADRMQLPEPSFESEAHSLAPEGFSRPPMSYHPASRPQPLELSYLNINRSGSSDGMHAPPRSSTTHGTTDSEGGFFGSASSSFVTETTSVFAPSSSFLSHVSFNGVSVPTTPSVAAAPTLAPHREGSMESSSVGSSGYDLGPRLTRRTLQRGLSRKASSSASLLSDAEAELIDDEYTYSGSNSQSDVLVAYERQLSCGNSGNGSESNSFYGAYPAMDTTFLETPSSSAHSLQSQALVSRSGSSDQSSIRLAGTWLPHSGASSKQHSPTEKQGRSHSGSLSEVGSPPRDSSGVAMAGVSPSPSSGALNHRSEPALTLATAPPDTGCTTASCSTGSSADSVAPARASRQSALTEFYKPVRQSAYSGPKSSFFS